MSNVPASDAVESNHRVFIGLPVSPGGCIHHKTAESLLFASACGVPVTLMSHCLSALAMNFNILFNTCLSQQEPFTHFFLLHGDVSTPDPEFLQKMLAICEEENADVVSGIVAIKDSRGLTSTAFDTDLWRPRRLTMREAMKLPPRLTREEAVAFAGGDLLINTGFMLIKLGDWCRDVVFDFRNAIIKLANGERAVLMESEDWRFSRWANQCGLKLVATREIQIIHHGGEVRWTNYGDWGQRDSDTDVMEAPSYAQAPQRQENGHVERDAGIPDGNGHAGAVAADPAASR